MYIFELISKLRKDYKEKKGIFSKKSGAVQTQKNEAEKCNHIFVPIDSTRRVLSCSKCGLIIHKK